ncbi:GIY-YIG nuclease family protein [Paenibacillus sedimenti]|uniref:GIY-YIG nuclease family protein n=1 Tax=Paenibacillus sedimenti TaxID=2770274 RepID=A0A926QLZ8_9BACL|nr:GIY-YIG nuclease family protein [Paenibacillus sedimenti]MBD0384446.1 GIY-YIG nuclease family protein [Paenibacillus sedimenti]
MALDKQKKKELAAEYKQTFRAMGVYQIRNIENGKIYVDSSMDLDGARNRLAFMKQTNMNAIIELKQDWNEYGRDCFVFEELDRIKPREEFVTVVSDLKKYREEVDALLDLWLEKLQPYGDKGYNRLKR